MTSKDLSLHAAEEREEKKPEQLYHKIMDAGDEDERMFGNRYEIGIDVDRDMKKAMPLFHEALEKEMSTRRKF